MKVQYGITGLSLITAVVVMVSCSRSAKPTSNSPAPLFPAQAQVYGFEDGKPGKVPLGFTPALTGGGGPVKWHVRELDDAPSGTQVVAQLSDDSTNAR